MWTKVLIVLLCIPLILGASGCVVTGWILPDAHGPDSSFGGLAKGHPEPGSHAYHISVVWGFIGDTLWIPVFGLGFVWWLIDALYVWVMGGGYAERWYRTYGDRSPATERATEAPAEDRSDIAPPR